MSYYLGIDCGGSKTAAVIIDDAGAELGRGFGGAANVATADDRLLTRSIRESVESALSSAALNQDMEFRAVCIGVAGYSLEARRNTSLEIVKRLVRAEYYQIEPDYLIAYWGATHGAPGIVVIAGTGAVSYGRNDKGEERREDGLGYLLGDRGSGFNLGLYALRYALRQVQAGRCDALTQTVLDHTGAKTQSEVLQWLYGNFSPTRVALLSPLIGKLAEDEDGPSRNLITEMARRLRHSVRQIRHTLWLPRESPVYPLGGLWQLGTFFRAEFADPHWAGTPDSPIAPEPLSGGRFVLCEPLNDPAYGAALRGILAATENNNEEAPKAGEG